MAVGQAIITFNKSLDPTNIQSEFTLGSERNILAKTIFVMAKNANINSPDWVIESSDSWLRPTVITVDGNGDPLVELIDGQYYAYARVVLGVDRNSGFNRTARLTAQCRDTVGALSVKYNLNITQEGEQGDIVVVPERLYIPDQDVIKNYKIDASYDTRGYNFNIFYENCDKETLEVAKDAGIDVQILSVYDNYASIYVSPISDNITYEPKVFNFNLSITTNSGGWRTVGVTITQAWMAQDMDDTAYIQFGSPYFTTNYTEKGRTANTHIEVPYFISYVHPTGVIMTKTESFVSNYVSQASTTDSNIIPTPQLNNVGDYSSGRGVVMIGFTGNNTNLDRSAVLTLSAPSMINTGRTVTSKLTITQGGRPNDNVNLSEEIISVDARKNVRYITYTKGSQDVIIDEITADAEDSDWIGIVREDSINRFTITIQPNNNSQERKSVVTVKSHLRGESSFYYTFLTVKQIGVIDDSESPIWKDNYITIYSEKMYIDYKFKVNNEDIYIGRAFTNNGSVRIKTNDILKNYMEESLNFDDVMLKFGQGGYISADMYMSDDEWTTEYFYQKVISYNDWSYKPFDGYDFKYPISNILDKRQYFTYTVFDSISTSGGTTAMVVLNLSTGDNESYALNINNSVETITAPLYNVDHVRYACRNEYESPDMKVIDVELTCNDYALYYKNKRGGWDSCLFNDAAKQVDKITINSYQRDVEAGSVRHGTYQFQKNLVRTWQLKSGRLTDEQSKIISEHLMTTNKAYLHIFETNELVPVNITDTTVNHLTKANNSRKKATYTITVEDSQTKYIC